MTFANNCLDSGYTTLKDVPGVEVDQCTEGTVSMTLHDPSTAHEIDLTAYGIYNDSSSSSSGDFTGVKVVIKEMPESQTVWATIEATVVDAVNGAITWDYSGNTVVRAGIFTAETQIWQDGVRRRVLPFFFIVNPSLAGVASNSRQMLSIAEIRMTLRDSDAAANFLIDELDFKTNEIALMIRRCVDYWNEQPPPVGTYTAASFPWRYNLSLGVAAQLHKMASVHKMRNDLDYNAGGITVQDTKNWQTYAAVGDQLWSQWVDWVRHKKYQLNVEGAFATLRSGYAYGYFYR